MEDGVQKKDEKLQTQNGTVKEVDVNRQQSGKKRKKEKEVAIFGNYRNYYNYRIDQGLEEDPRIKIMKKEWFEGKNCLDIGCNSGLITIAIAKKFGCQKMLGIDIDSARIDDAYWNLRRIVKMDERKKHPRTCKLNDSGPDGTTESPNEETKISGDSPASSLFDQISFRKNNFVKDWSSPGEKKYDTILCLSVTKWIQLNWGDDGLTTLFAKVWRMLQPGGVFILEPQPWQSYVNNRQVSEVARTNYRNIEIQPHQFQEVLLDKIGFRKVESLSSRLSVTKGGFNRPILAFSK